MPGERIASLLASATEIVCGLGLGDRLVAISHECDYPPEVTSKPRVTFTTIDAEQSSAGINEQVKDCLRSGRPLYEIDVETLASLGPDLIVTQSQCDVCAVKYEDVVKVVRTVDALGQTEIVDLNPASLEDIFRDIERVGAAVGCADRAGDYVAALKARVDVVRSAISGVSPGDRPRVVCVEWTEPLMVAANWLPELIDVAGGRCTITTSGQPSTHTDWDDVVAFDPEVIIVMPCGFGLARSEAEVQTLSRRPGWSDLAAVRADRVWAVDGNAYFNRSGPRIVDSLEILAHALHPDRVERPWPSDAPAARRVSASVGS